jgi:hypothetical protein
MENNSRGLNRLRTLYPFVCEDEGFPLPLCWSSEVKFYFVSLSENKLRVTYKGIEKGFIFRHFGSSVIVNSNLHVFTEKL